MSGTPLSAPREHQVTEREGASATAYAHVYVHVPFCARRCSYCDFAIAVRRVVPVDDYLRALAEELAIRRASIDAHRPVETLYLGGGTPSRLGGEGVARVMALLRSVFTPGSAAEVTVEANPEDVERDVVARWRDAGVTRVSLGVQSFDPRVLRWMHRTHAVDGVYRAVEALHGGGITDWSLDLIYALPPEVERDWRSDVRAALALAPTHLSAYGMTVEPGTPLARWRDRGEVHVADEERHEADFLLAHALLSAAGFEHYEVSNWARPGFRARHNSAYWRGVPYLGLGPGAHGFDGNVRRWNEREYVRWRERAAAGEDPLGGDERLSGEQRALETAYVGLRTVDGLDIDARDAVVIDRWISQGWANRAGERLSLTPRGWLRLDALVAALTEHRSRY
jgi:oxygen-independent coproporphyrinogen III oxidase